MMKAIGVFFTCIFVLVILLGIGSCSMYNTLVTGDETVNNEWADVESNLQRRNDLIPNLVSTVKGYAKQEEKVLTEVTKARQQVNNINLKGVLNDPAAMQKLAAAESQLSGALSRLLVTIEKYPDLKADKAFMNLQHELSGTENRINIARQRFNKSVGTQNSRIRKFPHSLLAGVAGVDKREYFKAEEGAEKVPDVSFE